MLVIVLGALPALVLMGLVSRFDARRPEPAAALRKVAFWGGISTLPAIVVEMALSAFAPAEPLQRSLYSAFVVAALTEETAKALVLYFAIWRHPAFDERLDGIVYATRAGLGFALVENVLYLAQAQAGGFAGVFVVRAVFAVPGHAIYAGFMGYWAARRRFDGVGPGLLGGLLIAVALHGAYDGALFIASSAGSQGDFTAGHAALLLVPLAVVWGGYRRLRRHAEDALKLDDAAHAAREAAEAGLPWREAGLGFLLR